MTWRWPLALLTAAALPATTFAQGASPAARVAEILEASGDVEISRGAGAPWTPARTGQELIGTDAIRTRASAFARIKFEAGLQWMLRAASQMELRAALAGAANTNTIRVRLESGKAVASWTPNRAAAARAGSAAPRAIVETPSGQASILGTEWSLNVEDNGRTALVVLTGSVELSNTLGAVTVGANEAAEMRVGHPPTLLRIINPSDRVQWVADYAAQPSRYADASTGTARAEFDRSVSDAAAGRTTLAIERLTGLAATDEASPGVRLALADLLLAAGELERSRTELEEGRQRHPADARFDALLARVALFDGRTADSLALATGATTRNPQAVEGWLALGETARSGGDGPTARRAFARATVVNPDDARGWYGLGGVETDYEAFGPARRWLNRALLIDPNGPGYRGEMGTVETLANNFNAAKREFSQALSERPGDYVALTGRALLALKEGREAEALDLLLRATLIEPGYARAQVYLGVTYYRLRRHDDAIRSLTRASQIDTKDPLPYLMAAAIYTDLYQPSLAMAISRKARELMPNLKSLNQLANTQKGTANLGSAVAFFGMEPWAMHLAQESYYPFWAGSHLFLGDRYANEFARTSEYYQGLLTDPTVFGGSPMFQTLLPRAGSYFTGDTTLTHGSDRTRGAEAALAANGYLNAVVPIGYAVTMRGGRWNTAEPRLNGLASPIGGSAAVGIALSPRWSLFATGAAAEEVERFDMDFDDDGVFASRWSKRGRHFEAGVNFRPSPTSSIVARVAGGAAEASLPVPELFPIMSFLSEPADLQARYTVIRDGRHEFSAGFDLSSERQEFRLNLFGEDINVDRNMQSAQVYVSARSRWRRLVLQADVFGGREQVLLHPAGVAPSYTANMLQPRLAAAIGIGSGVLRGVFQQRTRPWAARSTLGPVATAGIPVDDQFVQAGGDQRRFLTQLEWEWSPRMFTTVFAEHQRIANRPEQNLLEDFMSNMEGALGGSASGEGRPAVGSLNELRNIARDASQLNVTAMNLVEGDPNAVQATVAIAGVALNRVITTQVSLSTRYSFSATSDPATLVLGPGGVSASQELSFVPRHLFAAGAAWVSPRRIYLSAEAIHRSRRFGQVYDDHTDLLRNPRHPDWTARVAGGWESRDKHWALEFAGFDLLSKHAPSTYQLSAKFRR